MDAYQQAVEHLTANPEEIYPAWNHGGRPTEQPGGVLFRPVGTHGNCGCLTQVRTCQYGSEAQTPGLTMGIRADKRIPTRAIDITPDHLPIFAGWQRRIDQILGRTPPAMDLRIPMPTGDIEIPPVEVNLPVQV
jgi:hypothetical protein